MKKLIIWLLLLATSFTADAQLIGGGPRKPKGSGSTVDLSGYAVKAANNAFTGNNTFSGGVNYTAPWAGYQATYGQVNEGGNVRFLRGADGLLGGRVGMSSATGNVAEMVSNGPLQFVSSWYTRFYTAGAESLRIFTNGNIRFGASGIDNGNKVQVEGSIAADGNITAPNLLYHGGNALGVPLQIGTTDNQPISLFVNGFHVGAVNSGGRYEGSGIGNIANANNSIVATSTTGTVIARNVSDANPALTVEQNNSGSTGHILLLRSNGAGRSLFRSDGGLLIKTVVNAGFGLDVNDNARIVGNLWLNDGVISKTTGSNYNVDAGVIVSGTIQATQNVRASTGIITGTTSALDASSVLEARSTTKGFLPPRMTEAQKNAITSPAEGLMIYQTSAPKGWYGYDGASWVKMNP